MSRTLRARVDLAALVTRAVVTKLAGLWLAMLILGAVIFGPNGLAARDVTRGMAAVPWAFALVIALWSIAHLRASRVLDAQEFAFVRALPLSALDRFAALRAPTLAPHAVIGAFFARGEGALVGIVVAALGALSTVALRTLLASISRDTTQSRLSPSGLLAAHARWALRTDTAALARSSAFALASTALATVAVRNTRLDPSTHATLATVLLLLSSGAVALTASRSVTESERSLAFVLDTLPDARSAANRARALATLASPAAIGALFAALATSSLGATVAARCAVLYAVHWLAIAAIVEGASRRGRDPSSAAVLATLAAVIVAMLRTPLELAPAAALVAITAIALSNGRP
ncbi:MAG: hypothetical protein JNK05_25120 [Myxococcales bacterium]|nr:hypothetical protein [Myxococcales bacterium]